MLSNLLNAVIIENKSHTINLVVKLTGQIGDS